MQGKGFWGNLWRDVWSIMDKGRKMNRKKLLFMYIGNSCGIQEEGFNFSTKEQFCVKKSNNMYSILKGKGYQNVLPNNFWGERISDVNLLIGDNGSGKTTIMRVMCQWISYFSQGCLPQEKGIVVLQENDSQGFIAFNKGQKLTITANFEIKQYSEKDLMEFFHDLRLIYFSNSMSDLNVGKFENLSDYSMANRIKEANSQGTVICEDILANYNRWEFNNQINEALKKDNFPVKYLCMEIRSLPFEEIEECLPVEKQYIAKGLEDFWRHYFGVYDKETILKRRLSGLDLLQTVFAGVIIKLIKWEKDNTLPEEEKFVLKTLEEILRWEITTSNEPNIDRGQVWVTNLLKDLILDSKKKYRKTIYSDKYQSIAKDNIIKYIDQFIKFIVKDVKQEKKVFLEEWKFRLENEKRYIWQWKLEAKNKHFFQEFWKVYGNLVSYVENIGFYWDASSGERNWASLFSAMLKFREKDTNIWLLLDEPDIAFHPEWQRKLMKKIIETCKNYGNRSVQAWISTHSPIMLSDVPGNSVIYLKEKGKYPSPFEKTFAQNIYVLFNSAFVLENGIIGDFATDKILDVLLDLKEIEKKLFEKKENIKELSGKLDYCEKIINLVAEPVLNQQMNNYLLKCKRLLRIRLEND